MIVKWKLAAVMVAACLGLTGFGAWQSSAQPLTATPANRPAAAPPEKPTEKAAGAPKPPEPVATIFGGVPVTREAFADHLIRRYGKKELELFVNKQVVAHAFGRKGWTIKADDVLAALGEDCKALGMTRDKFVADVLPRQGKTLEQWAEDVVEPRLMLSQLIKAKLPPVTEAELREAFDAKYGGTVMCRVVCWTKEEGDAARKASEEISKTPAAFERYAYQESNGKWRDVGQLVPHPRNPTLSAGALEVAAAKLNKPDEISPLVATDTGFVILKCFSFFPAQKDKSFETEKPTLLAEVVQKQIERETPKLFAELKKQADPKYHLTFPEPVPPPKK